MTMIVKLFKQIPQAATAKRDAVAFFDTVRLHPGQRLYMFNMLEDKLSEVIMQTDRLMIKDGCFYAPAINEGIARKKFKKMIHLH